MYRTILLNEDQAQSLIGQLVRLEWGGITQIGVATHLEGHFLYFTGRDGDSQNLRVLEGMYAILATTADNIREDEEPAPMIHWPNRHSYQEP